MKRILSTCAVVMLSFVLFSFIGTPQEANYEMIHETIPAIEVETSSFTEWEDNHYTSDKQVFFKRIRYWDEFSGSASLDQMAEVLSRN